MTLNITVLTSGAIFQSSDFQLTEFGTNTFVRESNKTVEFSYPDWKGFITYSGIGDWRDRDISSLLGIWTAGKTGITPDDLATLIRTRSTKLFDEISQRNKRY